MNKAGIFSPEKGNSGRQVELDIAKGLAVLFMILIHVQGDFGTETMQKSSVGNILSFLGGVPSAPVFMFLLGTGVVYSRKQDVQTFVKRGFQLIISGYVLNFFRGTLPVIVQGIYEGESFFQEAVFDFFNVDILQFAGLALIFIGLIKKWQLKNWAILSIALCTTILNYFLKFIWVENEWLSAVSSLFWGSSYKSHFPFMTWIFYPLMGMIFASYLIRCTDKKKMYTILMILSFLVMIPFTYISWYFTPEGDYGYYHHGFVSNIQLTAMVLFWIGLLYFVAMPMPASVKKYFARLSANVNNIFAIHWVIIGWSAIVLGYNDMGVLGVLVTALMIAVISDGLAVLYKWLKTKKIHAS